MGGFCEGLEERELGLGERGEWLREVDFAATCSQGQRSDAGDMGGEARSMKEPWTGFELTGDGIDKERKEAAEYIVLERGLYEILTAPTGH